jgi:hypothetical protein
MSLSDDFLATLAGATVAGVIGFITLLIQQRLDSRTRVDEELLAPAFSYVMALPSGCPWSTLPDPVWASLDSYRWLKIPTRYRIPLREMSARLDAYSKSYARYGEFMTEIGWASFATPVRSSLFQYVTSDGASISARSVGLETGAILQVQWVVAGIVPYVLMNPRDPETAWDQLINTGPKLFYWAEQLIQTLRKSDPVALQKLFEAVTSSPDTLKARTLIADVSATFGRVADQAKVVSALLSERLGVRS